MHIHGSLNQLNPLALSDNRSIERADAARRAATTRRKLATFASSFDLEENSDRVTWSESYRDPSQPRREKPGQPSFGSLFSIDA